MKANDIKARSYNIEGDALKVEFEAGYDVVSTADFSVIEIKTDEGSTVEYFTGYKKRRTTVDADTGFVTVEFVLMPDEVNASLSRLSSLTSEVAITAQSASTKADEASTKADEAKAMAESAGNEQVSAAAALFVNSASLTDEQALTVSTLFDEWSANSVEYKEDQIVRYNERLYRCEQAHTSQESWTPDSAASLWSAIDIAEDGVEVWTQPTGAHNAYNTGDRVHYPTKDDPVYVSKIDGNVWAPDAYPDGWDPESE